MQKQSQINFWGIGTQKSGTTWLHSNLKNLPEFDLLPIKEIHYFDRNPKYLSTNKLAESRLIKRLINPKWLAKSIRNILYFIAHKDIAKAKLYWKLHFSNFNDDWYLSLFDSCIGYKGEITPSYSFLHEKDIRKMYAMSPNAKLILMLRNPIERDWSTYRFATRNKANFSFEDVTMEEAIGFLDSEGVNIRSNYLQTIQNYSKVFPKNQILICFYDAIISHPTQLLQEIVHFITDGSDISLEHLDLKKRINVSRKINCPEKIHQHLKKKHYHQIKTLAGTYGGYFSKWLENNYEETSLPIHPLSSTIALQ